MVRANGKMLIKGKIMRGEAKKNAWKKDFSPQNRHDVKTEKREDRMRHTRGVLGGTSGPLSEWRAGLQGQIGKGKNKT